ncbi:MAG: SBBP repeat-containing protein [Candidatus Hodarchaeales archaeon]|jgi:uncharacterized delta-60 repeat protein
MGETHYRKATCLAILLVGLFTLNHTNLFNSEITSTRTSRVLSSTEEAVEEDELRMKYIFSRLLGGGKEDVGNAIGIDTQGRIIITGNTETDGFPVLDAYDTSYNGPAEIYFEGDAFLASFLPNGTLYWSTYFGGELSDYGADLVIDSQDNIIITGETDSTDFPILNAADPSHNGNTDGFLAKFSPTGTLLWSTFIGDQGYDHGWGVAVDSLDNIYVTGRWEALPIRNNYWDAYVAKYSSDGTFEWLKTVGGSQLDYGHSIALDSQGEIVITGITSSSDFPNDNNYQGSQQEVFLTKLSSSGELVWSNVIGGSSTDSCNTVQVDPEDNIIIAGRTFSSDYPTLNAEDSVLDGQEDIILSKFDKNGSMVWSTYLGGSHSELTDKIYVDDDGRIYLSGETFSMDYPLTNISQSYLLSDSAQAMLTVLSPAGNILWSETFGAIKGSHISDRGRALVVDSDKNVIIVGFTYSNYFPVTTADSHSGEMDVFLCALYNPFEERPIPTTPTTTDTSTTITSIIDSKSNPGITSGFTIGMLLVFPILMFWRKRRKSP